MACLFASIPCWLAATWASVSAEARLDRARGLGSPERKRTLVAMSRPLSSPTPSTPTLRPRYERGRRGVFPDQAEPPLARAHVGVRPVSTATTLP